MSVEVIVKTSPTTEVETLVPPKIDKVSLLLSATAVPELDNTFLNIDCEEPLSEFVIVIAPEVPPPLIPVPAPTEVISPCGIVNDVLNVPPSLCVRVIVVVEEPESEIPVIVLS